MIRAISMRKAAYYTSLGLMSLFYIAAGAYHFIDPEFYYRMIPSYLPFPKEINVLSGALEIILGLAVLSENTRRPAAWGIVLLLIAVYPANIQMSINAYLNQDPKFVLTLVRLPFQFVFLAWAWVYTRASR